MAPVLIASLLAVAVAFLTYVLLDLRPARVTEHRDLMRRLGLQSAASAGSRTGRDEARRALLTSKRIPRLARLELWLLQSGKSFTPAEFFLLCVLCIGGGFLVGSWYFDPATAMLLGAGAGAAPSFYLARLRKNRLRAFARQLPLVLDVLKSGLQAGHTLLRGLQMASENQPAPICDEIKLVVEQVRMGVSLEVAFENMLKRVPEESLSFLIAAVSMQNQVGSSLAEVTGHAAAALRNRQRIDERVSSLTAQARTSAIVVSILPLFVLAGFMLFSPSYTRPLFVNNIGQTILKIALALDVGAFVVMRKMAQVEY